jgi:hypothetical protein
VLYGSDAGVARLEAPIELGGWLSVRRRIRSAGAAERRGRQRLILALGNVARRAGWERFVTQPLLEPNPRYFPDPWTRSARGAYRLARRLLVYAGLDDREVDLQVFRTTDGDHYRTAEGASYPQGPDHAAATYAGSSDEAHHFGIDVRKLLEEETLVAAMCHEVAHAFRAARGLVVTTWNAEEQLTDLTTVYLGFGILSLNGAYRYRTGGSFRGGYATLEWSHSKLGYLGAGEMAFLLAVQMIVRGTDAGEIARIAEQLELTQSSLFRQAIRELSADREALIEQLELPDPESWPAPQPLERFLKPIGAGREAEYDDSPPKEVTAKDTRNDGKPVFRVRIPRTGTASTLGATVGAVPAIVLASSGTLEAVWLVVVGALVGVVLGRRMFRYACSDQQCEADLTRDDAECPRCGGVVRGTIGSARDRLGAEEELEEGTFRSIE